MKTVRNFVPLNFTPEPIKSVVNIDADTTDVFVYDEIGYWGITADALKEELKQVKTGKINLRINSPGGGVFDANAMFNLIKEHKAYVTTHIDGLAASAASYLALAGDEVHMAQNGMFMIHDPWSFTWGDAAAMRKEAALLDKIRDVIAGTYQRETGQDLDDIIQKMADETWFDANEAKAYGLADLIKGDEDASAKMVFDVSKYANVPSQYKRHIEDSLRDAGFSRAAAKAIAGGKFDALHLRDAGTGAAQRDAENDDICKAISALTQTIQQNT